MSSTNEQKKPHCLLAEDAKDIQDYFTALMKKLNIDITITSNGREALDKINTAKEKGATFDFFIIDIMMPVMDGLQLMRELRSFPEYENTPIIIASAINDKIKVTEIHKEFNIRDFFIKPIDTDRLISSIHSLLSGIIN